jgi:hypothetical protein
MLSFLSLRYLLHTFGDSVIGERQILSSVSYLLSPPPPTRCLNLYPAISVPTVNISKNKEKLLTKQSPLVVEE